jgi:hypothetical protein
MSYSLSDVQRAKSEKPADLQAAQDTMEAILSRSATDREFRTQLLTDPRTAVSEYTGLHMENFNAVFVENTATATIVLPDLVDPSAELAETELEAVAGGVTIVMSIAGIVTTALMIYNAATDHNKEPS